MRNTERVIKSPGAGIGVSSDRAEKTADGPGRAGRESDAPDRKVILVVSFGTSYTKSRENAIGSVEAAVRTAFPEYEVQRAFTSQVIIDKLREREGEVIDNVEEALERLAAGGVRELIIQPTHVISGFEYDDMRAAAQPYEKLFPSVSYGKPLLSDMCDYQELAAALEKAAKNYDREKNAIVFMGHGTEHPANAIYTELAEYLKSSGYHNYYIGTVEAVPSLEDVMDLVGEETYENVILLPLMIVAGDHAINDMAGEEENSWKCRFESRGYKVECILKGLGEYPDIQRMFVRHIREAAASGREL